MTLPDLKWTPHPLFPVPTAAELRATLAEPDGAERIAHAYARRENAILDADSGMTFKDWLKCKRERC